MTAGPGRFGEQLAFHAGAFRLTFTDLGLVAASAAPGSGLPLFADLGLVDTSLAPRPALASWDSTLARAHLP